MDDSSNPVSDGQHAGVLAGLPRRKFLDVSQGDASLSQMRFISFKVNHFRSFVRLLNWFLLIFNFIFNISVDILLRRDNPKKRAVRLRRAFESKGDSFIKLGLHLSMRLDFMPWVYSSELSCMTDEREPFPVEQAIATIERSLGKPLSKIFTQFDPVPIISTTVACSFQAILHSEEKVIVKVRRPGIGEQFMADIEAFDWLLSIAEFLTIFRPGFSQGMRTEFRELLLEELDFVQEARRQDSFRRAGNKSRKKFVSAPRVHLDLTTEEVVIDEFASGIWLWELIDAVENGNQAVLTRAQEMNINPKLVAKRLLWVNYWSWGENLFFQVNPNQHNVIVGQDSTLYFIDFSSTGTLNRTKRQALRQNLDFAWERDPQNMARAMLVLLEPLPPIDLIELVQELETYNWQLIYSLEASPESVSWQERTSAMQWAGMMQLVRKYGITVDIQVLRLIRSTLLFESAAVRLHRRIDFIRQYQTFKNYRAEQARRRVTDAMLDHADGKGNEQVIIRLDRIAHAVEGLMFRASHMLAIPSVNFNALMSKWSFVVFKFLGFIGQSAILSLFFALLANLISYLDGGQFLRLDRVFQAVVTNPVYQVIIIMLLFVNGRTILFRLDDKEV